MSGIVKGVFDVVAVLFDKIPLLDKLKGYRSALGLVGLAVISILQMKGIGSPDTLSALELGFLAFTGLALNAKVR